jgi:carbonic anhydrase/acetyltransferase-like protein (isoleucine patch superfamily)
MYRYIIEDKHFVPPFNEVASLLTIGTQPLKLHQEELFATYFKQGVELKGVFSDNSDVRTVAGECIVYRDNLWFDYEFLDYFMKAAKKSGKACRAAIAEDDKAFKTYTLQLTKDLKPTITQDGRSIYFLDLWYFPKGYDPSPLPVVVPSDAHEIGFYMVPDFMRTQSHSLTHYAPMRAVVSIETWVHVYFASIIFGTFARSGRLDKKIEHSFFASLKLLWRGVLEQKQVLSASGAVEIGEGCSIHPSAIITGPAKIGNNVSIGAGCIVDNCTIGDNVSIDAGCMMYQSTIGNNCFLPFRASLYLTAVMENVIIAQNTCLQMCVIGRNSFVGAGSTFTDFNLIAQKPIRAANRDGELESVGQVVLGSAVGHNCRIGSGMVVFPGRMIESDTILVASPQRRVVSRSVSYEESDHHFIQGGDAHKRLYPRHGETLPAEENW